MIVAVISNFVISHFILKLVDVKIKLLEAKKK